MSASNTVDLNSWSEFVGEVQKLREQQRHLRLENDAAYISDLLFRGQSDARWKLTTTLERYRPLSLTLYDYLKCILAAKTQIEAYTTKVGRSHL